MFLAMMPVGAWEALALFSMADKKLKVLILEDDKRRVNIFLKELWPYCSIKWVESVDACIIELKETKYDALFLDHDLEHTVYSDPSGKNVGFEVVRWLAGNKPAIGFVLVHSCNAYAAPLMYKDLVSAGYTALYTSFPNIKWDLFIEYIQLKTYKDKRLPCGDCQ